MLIVILLTCIGLLLMIKRIRSSLLIYRCIKERMQLPAKLFLIKSKSYNEWGFLILCVVSIILIIYNIENPSSTGLGILVFCIGVGEFINALVMKNFYYDQTGFYYAQYYIKYKDIAKLTDRKGLLGLSTIYRVDTTHGVLSISKEAYEYLKQKHKGKTRT